MDRFFGNFSELDGDRLVPYWREEIRSAPCFDRLQSTRWALFSSRRYVAQLRHVHAVLLRCCLLSVEAPMRLATQAVQDIPVTLLLESLTQ